METGIVSRNFASTFLNCGIFTISTLHQQIHPKWCPGRDDWRFEWNTFVFMKENRLYFGANGERLMVRRRPLNKRLPNTLYREYIKLAPEILVCRGTAYHRYEFFAIISKTMNKERFMWDISLAAKVIFQTVISNQPPLINAITLSTSLIK
ncbi:hypothetical protein AVEN_61026-1 [Araneus ventricosus]|uniref:Uncharacterized protein n=1 Tax=Araneus ventricosus TaxID=182803 RepID=A0A4Y2J4T3_ARAVE|nr:hypothetical protein AVEN_61026-1 [Araneus ventricosus]